jgi:hypothetical protein
LPGQLLYFPAVLCALCDSPIDALVALCVPRDEAMALVVASWGDDPPSCVLATLDGGRRVAALRTEQGRWAACNAFHEYASTTRGDAERALQKLLSRGRRGYIGFVATDKKKPAQN